MEHSITYALIEIDDPRATAAGLTSSNPRTTPRRDGRAGPDGRRRARPEVRRGAAGLDRPDPEGDGLVDRRPPPRVGRRAGGRPGRPAATGRPAGRRAGRAGAAARPVRRGGADPANSWPLGCATRRRAGRAGGAACRPWPVGPEGEGGAARVGRGAGDRPRDGASSANADLVAAAIATIRACRSPPAATSPSPAPPACSASPPMPPTRPGSGSTPWPPCPAASSSPIRTSSTFLIGSSIATGPWRRARPPPTSWRRPSSRPDSSDRLADALATAGPVEADRLLAAFEQSTDEALGLKLVNVLARLAGPARA